MNNQRMNAHGHGMHLLRYSLSNTTNSRKSWKDSSRNRLPSILDDKDNSLQSILGESRKSIPSILNDDENCLSSNRRESRKGLPSILTQEDVTMGELMPSILADDEVMPSILVEDELMPSILVDDELDSKVSRQRKLFPTNLQHNDTNASGRNLDEAFKSTSRKYQQELSLNEANRNREANISSCRKHIAATRFLKHVSSSDLVEEPISKERYSSKKRKNPVFSSLFAVCLK